MHAEHSVHSNGKTALNPERLMFRGFGSWLHKLLARKACQVFGCPFIHLSVVTHYSIDTHIHRTA